MARDVAHEGTSIKIVIFAFVVRCAGNSHHRVCVSVCVCVSHAGMVSKRLNIGSRKQRDVIAHLTLPFISSLHVIVDISNLIRGLNIVSPRLRMTNRR